MKKNYFKSHINLSSIAEISKTYYLLLIVLVCFLFSIDSHGQSITSFTPTEACSNSAISVQITGTNFSGTTSVTFNTVAATFFTVDSDTQITATLPATATTGTISVTASGIAYSSETFTVNPLPTAAAGGSQTICSNATATVSGATATNGTILWTENGAGTITAGESTLTPTYTPTAADAGTTVTMTMTVTSDNTCAPQTASATYNIIVNPLPTAAAGGSQTICSNATATVSGATATNGTILWTENGAGTITSGVNTLTPTYTPTAADAGTTVTMTMTVTSDNTCAPQTTSATYNIIVNPLPTATGGGSQTICSNATATVSGASAANGTILWTENGEGTITSGVNTLTPTYTPTAADAGTTVTMTMTVTSDNTCAPQTASATYSIIINPITQVNQPTSQIVCDSNPTSAVSFETINLSGTTSFSWTNNNSSIGLAASGNGNITSFTATNKGVSPIVATIIVTPILNKGGIDCTGSTKTFKITVNPTPNAVATPAAQTICSTGAITTMVLSGNVAGTTFNWTRDNTGTVTGIAANGSGNISGSLTNTTNAPITVTFTITPTANSCPGTAITATVLVNPTPNAVATNGTQTICSAGAITTMALSGNVAGTTYNWTRNNTTSVTGIAASGSGDISGSLTNTTNAPVTVTFTITPTANGCPGTPITATILVNPTPNAVATPAAQTICSTGAITTMVLSGNVAGTTFNWTSDNTGTVTGIAANGSGNISGSMTNTTNAPITVTFTITPIANGCPGTPITATVLVNPTPNAVATNGTQTICSAGTITTMALSGNVAGTTYNWIRNNTGNVTGIVASGSGNISGSLTNTTNVPVTVTFTITPTANGCPGTPITATILVNPTPNAVATPAAQTICSTGAITTMVLSGNVAGTTYNWTRNNTGTVTGIAANGSGNISGSLTNTTSAPITVTFAITPTANSCSGTPVTATVLVNPTPNAVATPASQTICSANTITTMILSGSVAGTTFNWTRDNTGTVTGIGANGSGNISGSLTNTTNAPITVTFTITPTANGCPGTPITATVLVEAASVGGAVTISQPNVLPVEKTTTVCHKATGTLYLSGYTGTIIRWESSTTGGTSWVSIPNTNPTYEYPEILTTTIYRAVIQNGPYCTTLYSTSAMINVIPNIKPSPVTATPSTICAGESSVLYSESGYATSQYIEPGGDFGNSNPANWTVDGCPTCLSAGNSNTNPGPFKLSATNGGTYSGVKYKSSGKFAIANGNYNSVLETPIFNTLGLSSASLQFNHAYNLLAGAWGTVEISVDGGVSYTSILTQFNGPGTQQPYDPISTTINLDLNQYLGLSNLRVRFNYHGTVGSSWAIDNILIPDVPVNLTTEWVDASTNLVISTSATVTVTPTVTTTYAVTSRLNGCTSFGPEGTTYVTVIVNQKPVITATDAIICSGETSNIPLTSSETGTTFAWTVVQTNVSGASAGSGSAILQTLTATGTAPGTAVYTITPTAKGCVGPTKTVTITVNPKPTVSLTTASVCSGELITVPTAFSTIGTTFTWTVVQTNVTGASAGTGNTIAHTLTAINGLSGTAIYTVTPTANGCVGLPQVVTINVNPKPTAVMGPIQTICYGGTATFSIALTGTPPWNLTYTDGTNPTTVTTSTNPYIFSVTNITADKTYTLSSMGDAQCFANPTDITGSATVTVLNGIPGLWTGLVSTDWFNCLNWAGGLPSNTVNAVINSGMPRMPIIDPANSPFAAAYGNIASAQDLIIASGASVTMASLSNSDLHISRNWINRGSFVPGIGTVTFNGGALDQVQTINAGIKTNETFYNLILST